jgi:molybdopterin-containing oxidoreductase family membrane subunit
MSILFEKYGNKVWFVLLGACIIAAAVASANVFLVGHEQTFNTSRGVPWGILISTYVFLAISCSGLCMISSLGHVFGFHEFDMISRRAILLAILCLFGAFASIGMELEHPFKMFYTVLSPNLQSAIWWMGTIYGIYLCVLIVEFYALMTNNHKISNITGVVGLLFAIAAPSMLGAVFGLVLARPFWHGSFLPVYTIITAVVSGTALIILVMYFQHYVRGLEMDDTDRRVIRLLGRILRMVLFLLIFSVFWNVVMGLYGKQPGSYEPVMAMISGSLSVNFWLGEIIIGLVVPMGLLIRKDRTPFTTMLASLLAIVGMFFMRYDMTISGQLYPMRQRTDLVGGLFSYTPSVTEILIVLGCMAFSAMVYTLVERYMSLDLKSEDHS